MKKDEKFKNAKVMLDPRHAVSSIRKAINKTIEEGNIMMNNLQQNSNVNINEQSENSEKGETITKKPKNYRPKKITKRKKK